MPNEMAGVTTCKHCGERIIGTAVLIGAGRTIAAGRLAHLIEQLVQHLVEKHPRVAGAMEIAKAEFGGLALMLNYATTDASFQAQQDWLRWRVHQQTLNARITDLSIAEKVAETAEQVLFAYSAAVRDHTPAISFQSLMEERFTAILTEMRDALQEPKEPPNPLAGRSC